MTTMYLRDTDLAERYRVHRVTIWGWVQRYGLPAPVKLAGNSTRWKLSDIEKWEAKRENKEVAA